MIRKIDSRQQIKDLSLVMIVKNEERCIKRCLESVKDIVNEMIVVDTGSTDLTKEIAISCGAKVFDYKWENDFAKARNYALEQSTGEWNLIIDADEYITHINRDTLVTFMSNTKHIGCIKIINELHTDDGGNHSKVYIPRLLPKEVRYTRSIHEQPQSNLQRENVEIDLYHDGYLNQEVKVKRNLKYLREQVKKSPKDSYVLYQLAYTLFLDKQYEEADMYFEAFYKQVDLKAPYRNAGIISYIENNTRLHQFKKGHLLIEKEEIHLQSLSEFYFVCAAFYREYVLDNVQENISFLPFIEQCYLESLRIGENEGCDGAIGTGSYLAAYNLGVWYEVTKQYDKALEYYTMAEKWQYKKAMQRKKAIRDCIK